MAYSNLTFTVNTGLSLNTNDFVQLTSNITTTTTTTTTTTLILWVDAIKSNACSGVGTSLPTYSFSGGVNICTCTSLNAANATSLSAGTYYVAFGPIVRTFSSAGGGSTLLTPTASCIAC